MKTIKTTTETVVYKDHDAIIKIGPKKTILHEAEVLKRLSGLSFVPQLLGVTEAINDDKKMILVMTEVEGQPFTGVPVLTHMFKEMEARGIIAPVPNKEDVIKDGNRIGLVGFMSRAKIKEEF